MLYKMIYLQRRNPAIAMPDWARAWRSHAAYVSSTFKMAVAPIAGVNYCVRLFEPASDGTPVDPPEASQDYDGVAIAASTSADAFYGVKRGITKEEWCAESGLTMADRALIDADELRVFAGSVPDCGFRAYETVAHGAAPGRFAVIRLLCRNGGLSREAFAARYNGTHAEIAKAAASAGATRYIQNMVREDPPEGYPFDGVSETWFATDTDAARSLTDSIFAPLRRDLADFCDPGRSVTMLCRVGHRWPHEERVA